ncbi:MAG: carboxylate--amine ligase [Elusimicrobia bacterium]|nr:carboxylate--amine ligase [Elusimicrobiota bacterium]
MNILYLSPSFPPNYRRFPVCLREAGATVVGIGWQEAGSLSPEVRRSMADYCQVPDMGNYDHVLRAAGYLVSRVGKLDRVVSQEEHWIDLEAALRLDFNVPGDKPDAIRSLRRKSLMKEVFARAGVPAARGELAADLEAGLSFARRVGYPLIAKPDRGVGAHATCKLSDDGELEGFFRSRDPEVTYIIEEFLGGIIESFDGLTGKDGAILFTASHQFFPDIMTVVNEDDDLHYWSMRRIPPDLEDLGRRAIAAFGLRERFFHLEFIRGPRGRLTAMELNARPPGGLTTDMFNYANDIDVYREWANVVVHGTFAARCERPYHVCYIGRKSNKRYARSHEEVLRAYGPRILVHTPIDSVFRRAIGDYAYLVRDPELEQIQPIVAFIQQVRPE